MCSREPYSVSRQREGRLRLATDIAAEGPFPGAEGEEGPALRRSAGLGGSGGYRVAGQQRQGGLGSHQV